MDIILAVDTAPLFDLLVDEAGDHVARGQVLECRRVPGGERLAVPLRRMPPSPRAASERRMPSL